MIWVKNFLLSMVIVCLFQACFVFHEREPLTENSVNMQEFVEIEELPGLDAYGYVKDKSLVKEARVKRNESLYIILRSLDVTPEDIYTIQQKAKGKFNPRRINQNQKYYTYHDTKTGVPTRMIFHQTATDYVIFDWSNGIEVETGSKEIETEIATAYGTIESSLYETLAGQGVNILVANGLSEIFGWEVDFFRLYKGDKFKVIYEKRFVDGKPYGIGQIIAAEFEHRGQKYDAYFYESDEAYGYYDKDGNSVQKALLKAPFKYSQRISSNFSYNRFHPVLKRRMPHYGVDYAAPMGTPVISVGDGEIITSRYNGAAGHMVKIRHNSTYSTAYLHLNGYASGIKEGRRVKQGQVIGYVGKTGRVTGVHLHYNVYKNNQPVNPVKLVLPPSEGISDSELKDFKMAIESAQKELKQIGEGERLAEASL
ncbi:MAG: peptidoglycan DD-metalloendopeptidase family protein [Balneola sp.]